jgi:hypothetical protein
MQNVLLIEPNAPEVILWSRGADGEWTYEIFDGLGASVAVRGLGVELRLADLYADLTFRPAPKLVEGDET